MSFCGTLEHNRDAGFLTLAIHCIALYDPLITIMDSQYEGKKKKEQLELFPLSVEQRKDFAKLVKTLRYFLEAYRQDEIETKPKDKKNLWGLNGKCQGLDYCDYEFYAFWYNFIRGFKDDFEFEKQVDLLDNIAQGTPLKSYEPSIKFLSKLNSVALGQHNSNRRGCF